MINETQHMATVIPTINLFAVYQQANAYSRGKFNKANSFLAPQGPKS